MYSSVRFIILSFIILLLIPAEASCVTSSIFTIETPGLKVITINRDSILKVPSDSIGKALFFNRRIILSYKQNDISFEFTDDKNLEYQFCLTGSGEEWTKWRTSNFKEYTHLSAGNYVLLTKFRGSDNIVVDLPALMIKVLPIWYSSVQAIVFYLGLFVLVIWAVYEQLDLRFAHKQYLLEQIINKRTEDLIIEKEKSEKLLANVLPKNTASEIMEKGKATKIKYNFVTVLFSDIQGFTKIAEEMNPEVLIDELDKFFFYFDSVVEKLGIEKIKTIGDAYMCAGGIPEKNRTNPVEVILAALEMKVYMNRLKETSAIEGMKYWDIRIGIHTGTVVAGVVGQKKLSYDIWGDTVNIASRMESSGEAGRINISGTTYEFVKEFFECEFRGKMPVKYKGELEMYFVNGIVPELRDENGGPNRKFVVRMQMIKLQDIEEMILKMFDEEAPPDLYFHNSALVKNVNNMVELLSTAESLSDEEFINLKLAAVFLYTGYISDYEKPMEATLRLVEEILPKYGFSNLNIELTSSIIRDSYEERNETLGEKILHDAKYDYLGRVDYLKYTEKLLRERTEYGKVRDKKQWIEIQKKLLSEHQFLTDTARLLRSVTPEEQMAGLIDDQI